MDFQFVARLLTRVRFPEHHATRNRFSIWAESYGGHYAPVYANYFEEQNDRIAQGKLRGPAKPIHVDTVGLSQCVHRHRHADAILSGVRLQQHVWNQGNQ